MLKDSCNLDLYIGQQIRQARQLRRMSQKVLGSKLFRPVTFQQIQKYERGANHVTAVCLYDIATVLQIPLLYFLPQADYEMPSHSVQEIRLLEALRQLPAPVQETLHSFVLAAARSR